MLSRDSGVGLAVDVMRQLGVELLPWQHRVLDVALEVDGDGRLVHRSVTVSTPRQAGKTVLALAVIAHRLIHHDANLALYAAQNRMSARSRLLDTWWPLLHRSPFGDEMALSRGAGFEALRIDDGSALKILSALDSSGHGESVDLAVLDECWALDQAVEQAVRPATIARPESQIWAVSTAGDSTSAWWQGKIAAGRESVDDPDAGVYFEWGAHPDQDPGNPETWRSAHPGIGHLVDIDDVAKDYRALPEGEFRRAYLNQHDVAAGGWATVDQAVWNRAQL
jgi:phage terminase large subunit-like protein